MLLRYLCQRYLMWDHQPCHRSSLLLDCRLRVCPPPLPNVSMQHVLSLSASAQALTLPHPAPFSLPPICTNLVIVHLVLLPKHQHNPPPRDSATPPPSPLGSVWPVSCRPVPPTCTTPKHTQFSSVHAAHLPHPCCFPFHVLPVASTFPCCLTACPDDQPSVPNLTNSPTLERSALQAHAQAQAPAGPGVSPVPLSKVDAVYPAGDTTPGMLPVCTVMLKPLRSWCLGLVLQPFPETEATGNKWSALAPSQALSHVE